MITYDELYRAFLECYSKKKKTPGAIKFILHLHDNLRALLREINERTYVVSPSTVFIITDPKIREIFAADFRDRIIHHLVIRELLPLFQDYFIPDSFSCMPGKGNLCGVKVMQSYLDRCPPNWYVMKMDISSFFMGINRHLLAWSLECFIRERYKEWQKIEDLIWLCNTIILNDPTKDCVRVGNLELIKILPPEKSLFCVQPGLGLPIGNYSSQMFANFYMTPLDYFIKYYLGIALYGRYVDDFLMFGRKEQLLEARPYIIDFTRENLGLKVSEDKFYFQPTSHGAKFLGSMLMPGRSYCGNRVRGELEKTLYQDDSTDPIYLSRVNSYLGLMKHYSSFNVRRELLEETRSLWEKDYIVDPHYTKLVKRKTEIP